MNSNVTEPAALTVDEIARDMGVSRNTARGWVYREIPHFKTEGGHIRVSRADYEAWKESKRIVPEGALVPGRVA